MRILVVSDTHGNARALQETIRFQPTASVVIHLGDGVREAEDMADRFPDRTFCIVRGNCDFGADVLPMREEQFGGKRLFFTHGHLYDVKYGLYRISLAARERKADMVLFGHTHQPLSLYDDGLYLLNPGSLGHGRQYATVDISPAGIFPILHTLR
jgi:putative phosphoesterase